MSAFNAYVYGTAGWLSLKALTLIVVPKVIITLLSPEVRNATDLEEYFARFLGYAFLLIAVIVIYFSGAIPPSSTLAGSLPEEASNPKSPYGDRILTITTIFHSLCAIYYYIRYVNTKQIGFFLGMTGSIIMSVVGYWYMMFGKDKGHLSKRTGADKRTSGFPFTNAEAAKRKAGKAY